MNSCSQELRGRETRRIRQSGTVSSLFLWQVWLADVGCRKWISSRLVVNAYENLHPLVQAVVHHQGMTHTYPSWLHPTKAS
jgi:hypothetical protein